MIDVLLQYIAGVIQKCEKDMRKSSIAYLALVPAFALPAVSCDSVFRQPEMGKGYLNVRFLDEKAAVPDKEDFILSVTDAEGGSIYYGKYGDAPETIIADPGSYTVSAVSREFKEPLFDAPQYGDTKEAVVSAGQTSDVLLECTQQNAGIRLKIDRDFQSSYPNGALMVKSGFGKLMYGYSETRIAYFKPGLVSVILNNGPSEVTLFTRMLESRQVLVVNVTSGVDGQTKGCVDIQVDTSRNWISENYEMGSGASESDVSEALNVTQAKANSGATDVWVYGYIVGGDLSSSKCSFDAPFTSRTNIVLASKTSCRDKQACLSVQLSKGDVRDALNLVDHPENLGRKVYLKGDIVASYYGVEGLQGISEYMWK